MVMKPPAFPRFANVMLDDRFDDVKPWDRYGRDQRYSDDYRPPAAGAQIALQIIEAFKNERLSIGPLDRETERAIIDATEGVRKLLSEQHYLKDSAKDARDSRDKALREIMTMTEESTTIVIVPNKAEHTDWCDANAPDRWKFCDTSKGRAYMFEDKKTAALFKLMYFGN